jgi:hypothetical protein
MSEFGSAVTAMEMAVKALGLEGQISVEMDSDNQCIILDRAISLDIVQPHGITRGVRAVVSSIDEDTLDEDILSTDDVVEAVIEAVAQVVAEQAREHLYHIFETVDDGLEDGE